MAFVLVFFVVWIISIIASYLMFRKTHKRNGVVGAVEIVFMFVPFVNMFISSACLVATTSDLEKSFIDRFFFIK